MYKYNETKNKRIKKILVEYIKEAFAEIIVAKNTKKYCVLFDGLLFNYYLPLYYQNC